MATIEEAKRQLDLVMTKARITWYKPIQIAETLYHHRTEGSFDLENLASYRIKSKKWRDDITTLLLHQVSISSSKYQDHIFELTAIRPELLSSLGKANEDKANPGVVEAYIYASFRHRRELVSDLAAYLSSATPKSFVLQDFLAHFKEKPGLKKSIDKAYEIVVYALFDTLVHHLEATVTVKVPNSKRNLLVEFEDFTRIVLGITSENMEIIKPASLYRAGVANAADSGLDMWANFGPAIQVKHVSLDEELAEAIVSEVAENARIVIVCRDAQKAVIESVLTQSGFSGRVQGVVTEDDLKRWYGKCFSDQYRSTLGETLLKNLAKEYEQEFGSGAEIDAFMKERGYHKIELKGIWKLPPEVEQITFC